MISNIKDWILSLPFEVKVVAIALGFALIVGLVIALVSDPTKSKTWKNYAHTIFTTIAVTLGGLIVWIMFFESDPDPVVNLS